MYRSLLLLVLFGVPAFAQNSLKPKALDESMIDREAWLRDPFPAHEAIKIRAGLTPDSVTKYRFDTQNEGIPNDETFRIGDLKMSEFVRQIQGSWVTIRMSLDVNEVGAGYYSGTNYTFSGTAVAQGDSNEKISRRGRNIIPTMRPVLGQGLSEARAEEAINLEFVAGYDGGATIDFWDRYGESDDPNFNSNRPSARVVLPGKGRIQLVGDVLLLQGDGKGMRALLPANFHTDLGQGHSVSLQLARTQRAGISWPPGFGPKKPPK
jgi:hypothetical protein